MTGIYELLLRATDGRECRTLAWLPNDQCKDDYFKKASERGLTIEIINNYNYVNNATAPLRTGGQRD